MRSLTAAFFIALFSASAHAAPDPCACAAAACTAIAKSHNQSTASCDQMTKMTPAQCSPAMNGLLQAMKQLAMTPPAACDGAASADGGGGASSSATPSTDNAPPDRPPVPLSPNPTAPTPSGVSGGTLACVLTHPGGHRVVLAGSSQSFDVKCSGIALAGNPSGAGAPADPPQRSADGRAVSITWQSSAGVVSGLFAKAQWTAPSQANPAEVTVKATIKLAAGNGQPAESLTLPFTLHVVARTLELTFFGHTVNHCSDLGAGKGTLNVGFDLQCTMSMPLTVADDLSVTGSGGQSCGAGVLSNAQLCVPQMEKSYEAVPGWSFDSASGAIDPDSGVMTLSVSGNRIGLARVTFTNGKTNDVHPNALFGSSFTISPDNSSSRTFGSLTTTPVAGGTNSFTIQAH